MIGLTQITTESTLVMTIVLSIEERISHFLESLDNPDLFNAATLENIRNWKYGSDPQMLALLFLEVFWNPAALRDTENPGNESLLQPLQNEFLNILEVILQTDPMPLILEMDELNQKAVELENVGEKIVQEILSVINLSIQELITTANTHNNRELQEIGQTVKEELLALNRELVTQKVELVDQWSSISQIIQKEIANLTKFFHESEKLADEVLEIIDETKKDLERFMQVLGGNKP